MIVEATGQAIAARTSGATVGRVMVGPASGMVAARADREIARVVVAGRRLVAPSHVPMPSGGLQKFEKPVGRAGPYEHPTWSARRLRREKSSSGSMKVRCVTKRSLRPSAPPFGAADVDAEIAPDVVAEIQAAIDPQRAKRLTDRLASASAALDRDRFEEALRMVTPLRRDLPQVAAVHEVSGLASYRLGKWRQAAASLELARQLRPDPALLPVLADCYRGLKRWNDVESVWNDLRAASPTHEVMSEGRIVAASALADRGELKAAIALMMTGEKPPKKVRPYHLRQWYVLADLHDRAGDSITAARWFREIAAHDAGFADVRDRLRALGR